MNSQDTLPMKGISRVDKKGHYWFVRVNFSNRKPGIQKTFYDSRYDGDISKSFEAAVKFRNKNMSPSKRENHHLEGIEKEMAYTKKEIADSWKEERLKRRLKTIEELGEGKHYVGVGVEGMRKARKMGASKVTCWKILTGKQDCYSVSNFMPGYHLSWVDRARGRHPDIKAQKAAHGKKKVNVGNGRAAALQAQKTGMSQRVCNRIFAKKQDFCCPCYSVTHFEANGFLRDVPQEVEAEIKSIAYRYSYKDAAKIIQETMINYSSRLEIPNQKNFVRDLTFKYIKVNKMEKWGTKKERKSRPLDINGDIERTNREGGAFYGIGVELKAADGWNPSISPATSNP